MPGQTDRAPSRTSLEGGKSSLSRGSLERGDKQAIGRCSTGYSNSRPSESEFGSLGGFIDIGCSSATGNRYGPIQQDFMVRHSHFHWWDLAAGAGICSRLLPAEGWEQPLVASNLGGGSTLPQCEPVCTIASILSYTYNTEHTYLTYLPPHYWYVSA